MFPPTWWRRRRLRAAREEREQPEREREGQDLEGAVHGASMPRLTSGRCQDRRRPPRHSVIVNALITPMCCMLGAALSVIIAGATSTSGA